MQSIDLNIIPNGSTPICYASQFDNERKIRANLFEDLEPYTLTGNETVSFNARKPDKTVVTMALTNTADNYLIFETTEQLTAIYGDVLCDISISYDQELIATLNFILKVEIDPLYRGIQSESEIHNLEAQVNQMVEDAVAEQYDSNNVLFDTAPTLGHGVPYAVTSGGLWSWLCDLPLRAYPTASGSIATFDTSLALPLQDCTIDINAVQEAGTPTPSSPKAIIGFTGANIKVCGKNLIVFSDDTRTSSQNCTYSYSTGGISITANANYARIGFSFYTPIGATLTISFKGSGNGNINRVEWNDAVEWNDRHYGQQTLTETEKAYTKTITTTSNVLFFGCYLTGTSASGSMTLKDIQIEVGSSPTAFEQFTSTTYPVSWQDEAGTVYGGSLDVTSGKLTVTWGSYDMGSLNWSYDSSNTRMVSNIVPNMKETRTARTQKFLCPIYQVVSDGRPIGQVTNYSIYSSFYGSDGSGTNVYVHDSNYTDSTIFKTAMSGIYIVYPLETPVTYQLTPTQISAIVGTNNVFTDTNGNTSVVYACSLKDYIDGQ